MKPPVPTAVSQSSTMTRKSESVATMPSADICDHPADGVMWNPWNLVIQCHRCGAIIEELAHA